jgi:hypothetical protein
MWSAVTGRTLTIDVSQPTVVDRIQRLQRLETVIYTMDKIVTGAKENPLLPNFLAGDRLLMLVHGEVVAGIDFANLKPGDVMVDGKQIRLRLPPPQADRAAGLDRPGSGNASPPGGGTPTARGRHGRRYSAKRPAERDRDDHEPAAGSGIREDRVRLGSPLPSVLAHQQSSMSVMFSTFTRLR